MTADQELRRIQGALNLASMLLLAAVLAQLPLVVVMVVRFFVFSWTPPIKVYWFFNAVSSLFAIVGFIMVCRQLNLCEEAVENSFFPGVMRPRTLRGMELAGGVQLLFYGMFLVPLLNLPAILWGRARAKAAVRDIDAMLEDMRRKQKMPVRKL